MDDYERIMGLDIGDRRIGIAMSDPLKISAQGIETYERSEEDKDIEHILKLVNEWKVKTIVAGLPKNMSGSEGVQATKVRGFVDEIEKRTDAKIVFYDERLSTMMAQRVLDEANVHWKKQKKVVDKMAAIVILQSYLDSI